MRSYLIILIFLFGIVLARYHEKTRFDRSIHNGYKMKNIKSDYSEKQWSFIDDVKQFVAYKSKTENDCYLEDIKQNPNVQRKKWQLKVLYTSITLTKLEAWRLVGDRIIDFCNGSNIILVQATKPVVTQILDSFRNKIVVDENDISSIQVADMALTPLIARMRRQIQFEQREKLNNDFNRIRQRRQINQFQGKFRGQTQSQYLNVDSNEQKEGKVEAEATQQSSHARVIGNHGMGQAQSMSSGDTNCEDCVRYSGYPGIEGVPGKLRPSYAGDKSMYDTGTGTGTPDIAHPGMGIVSGGTIYPGSITPNGQITYPGGVNLGGNIYPDIFSGSRPGTYPGGVQPGTLVTSGRDEIYPGIVKSKADGIYPENIQPVSAGGLRPGTVILGSNKMYSGGVHSGTIRSDVDETYVGDIRSGLAVRPESVRPGTYPGTVTLEGGGTASIYPGLIRPGSDITYLGTSRPGITTPGAERTYLPGTVVTPSLYPGGVKSVPPITVTTEARTDAGTYPGSIQPTFQSGQGAYPPNNIRLGLTAGTYPIGTVPGVSGTYPESPGSTLPIGIDGTYPKTGIHFDSTRPSTVPAADTRIYPGGVAQGGVIGQGTYSADRQINGRYPGIVSGTSLDGRTIGFESQVQPGAVTTTSSSAGAGTQVIIYPANRLTNDQTIYPHLENVGQISKIPNGTGGMITSQVTYPVVGAFGRGAAPTYPIDGQFSQVVYPSSTQQVISSLGTPSTLYPNQEIYPDGRNQIGTMYPSVDTRIPTTDIPGRITIPGGIQYPISSAGEGQYHNQYSGRVSNQETGITTAKLSPGPVGSAGTGEIPQYMQSGTGQPTDVANSDAESQALSSVQQIDSGTQASASAHGKYGQSTSQSQVTGVHSGLGSFSAQAGTSDANKSAHVEISGSKDGAMSNAQGVAGHGKSQTQVQLDPDLGTTLTGAQSSGWNHDTTSQVQASSKGGMADAQANGEGSTSSQAQIGFQPYQEKVEKHDTPFRGSGTASAQSGTHRGQSQSQLQGSFQYGISYNGAAQAGSGSSAASSRKPFNFSITDTELFKPFKPQDTLKNPTGINNVQSNLASLRPKHNNRRDNHEHGLQNSSTWRQDIIINTKDNLGESAIEKKALPTNKPQTNDALYDEYDDDYADEYSDITRPLPSSSTRAFTHQRKLGKVPQQNRQMQIVQTAKGDRYGVNISQGLDVPQTVDILQPGYLYPGPLSGYMIPPGFRGRVMSILSAHGSNESQTVSLALKNSNDTKPFAIENRSLQTNHEHRLHQYPSNNKTKATPSNGQNTPSTSSVVMKPSYYTVTNSVAGKMNSNNASRKYEHRYYTKSSTCGYFTFSCNIVYGSNGRTKICKPKIPTYSDGTPMRC